MPLKVSEHMEAFETDYHDRLHTSLFAMSNIWTSINICFCSNISYVESCHKHSTLLNGNHYAQSTEITSKQINHEIFFLSLD